MPGIAGVVATHGLSPEVDPERWANARYVIVWAWNPLSTAPHLWRFLLDARKRSGAKLVVIDPFRSRTARVADEHLRPVPGTDGALALGMMRAVVDAGLHDDEWCRAHTTGFDDLLERLAGVAGRSSRRDHRHRRGRRSARIGEEFASTQPSLLRLGVGGQRHAGAPMAYRTIACLPALAGSWRHDGGGCAYIPTACASAVDWGPLQRADLRPGPVRTINMSQLGDALTDPTLDPPVKALVVWNSNPAQVAPDQTRVLAGLAPRRPVHGRARAVHDRHRPPRRRGAAGHDAARAPRRAVLVGAPLHHLQRAGDRAASARRSPTPRCSACWPPGSASTTRVSEETDEQLLDAVFAGAPGGITLERAARARLAEGRPRAGADAARRGRLRHADGKVAFRADWLADLGLDPLPTYEPPAEVADAELAERYPLALLTPKTHFFLNSTFANQRPPAPRPARAVRRRAPRRRRPRAAIADGDARAGLQRPRRVPARGARVSDDAPAGVARRADELVDARPRRRARRPGHDVAAPDRAGRGADVQRQPRGAGGVRVGAARAAPRRPRDPAAALRASRYAARSLRPSSASSTLSTAVVELSTAQLDVGRRAAARTGRRRR